MGKKKSQDDSNEVVRKLRDKFNPISEPKKPEKKLTYEEFREQFLKDYHPRHKGR